MTIEAEPLPRATILANTEILPRVELIPKVSNLAEFLEQTKAAVSVDWNARMVTKLGAYDLFSDQEALLAILEKDDFRQLETLRSIGQPDLWQEILADISQREIDSLTLARQMVESLSDEEIKSFKLSRQEIYLYLDLARDVQPLIDSAYREQVAKADKPGGKEEGPHAGIYGYGFLYNEDTAYINEFPDHFPKLVEVLNTYSSKVKQAADSGELPPIYSQLSDYLSLLAKNFADPETTPQTLKENWDYVSQEFARLAQAGCPILLVPWGFILDGNHIGIELMVGLNLGEDSKYYAESSQYTTAVTELARKDDSNYTPIPFVHLYTLTRNGDCLPWGGTACAGDFSIVMYDYENDRYARSLYRYLTRYAETNTTEEKFVYARAINTIAHEVGHLCRMLNERIYARLGQGISVGKVDEAKADLMSVIFYLQNQSVFPVTPVQYLEQYLVDYIEEFVNSHGHEEEDTGVVWYGFSGKLILHQLINCGAVEEVGDKLRINSKKAVKGLEKLAKLGCRVFGNYGNEKYTKSRLDNFIKYHEKRIEQDQVLQRFLGRIYCDHGLIAA